MPLCDMCRSEARYKDKNTGRIKTHPPHGMEWGEQCDRCKAKAAVTL